MIADSESIGPMVCLPVAPKLIASLLKAVFVFHFLQKAASDFLQAEINVLALLPCHYVHTSAVLCLHLYPSCKPLQGKEFLPPPPHFVFLSCFLHSTLHILGALLYVFYFLIKFSIKFVLGERTQEYCQFIIYVVFNNVSKERLVGDSSSPIFFCLDLGVERVGTQLCFFGTNGKPILLPLRFAYPWGLGRQPG